MKITIPKKLDLSLLGERKINEYSYNTMTGESTDGRMRSYEYMVCNKVYGTIENEVENSDGTYTYEYTSRIESDYGRNEIRNPEKSKFDLKDMIEELMFTYNIYEFSTDLQEKANSIKDYYVSIGATAVYIKDREPSFSYGYSIKNKDKKYYAIDEESSNYKYIKSESIDDINDKLNCGFSKEDYILYAKGDEVKKTYSIELGLDEIGEGETVRDYLRKISLENHKYATFEELLKENMISMNDIKNFIMENRNLSYTSMPSDILKQLFEEDKELILHFSERDIPSDILRKYNPKFDISRVDPNDLIPSDLDNLLQNVIQDKVIFGFYNGLTQKELFDGYWKFLQSFYDDLEALRKIIPVISTSRTDFFRKNAKEFIDQILPEVLEEKEIRDILLNTENISISQIMDYQLDYDTDSVKKLLELLSNTTIRCSLSDINGILDLMKKNEISNDEMVEALRKNGFNLYLSDYHIEEFKGFGVEGITLDDIRDNILKDKDFKFLKLCNNLTNDEVTREYYSLLNEMAEKKGHGNSKDKKLYEETLDLMVNYSNASELFSRLTPDVKKLTQKLMIEKMDEIEKLQDDPVGYATMMLIECMKQSFNISKEDLITIYMKCLNNGASQDDAIYEIMKYIELDERKSFKDKINALNIYPSPKRFWLADNNLIKIRIERGENRNTIKNKIQADGRCFSTKVKTDMNGISKDGKKIPINNLSKWLFGVPGTKGNLTITRAGDRIQLPGNTPDEAVALIESILQERTIKSHSK